ncbi:protein of unknown function (DUF3328) domain containing protein [Rhypophila sp. PSN 637]
MDDTKYETLSVDDHSESDNGTKPLLDSSLSPKVTSWQTKTVNRLRRLVPPPARPILSQTVLISYCAFSTTALVILTAIILSQQQQLLTSSQQPKQIFQATFGADPSYMSLDHKYDHLWEDLGSKGLIIKLPDADAGDNGNGKPPTPASISMFHQLHCLSSLRNALQQSREGVDPGLDWRDNDHWPHCLDYLRKTLLCRADNVVERRLVFDNGTVSRFIDGSQDVRQCGDNRRLIRIMREHGRVVNTVPFP